VSAGGVNIGKSFTGKVTTLEPDVLKNILASGYDAFSLIESLIEREKKIDCYWEKTGPLCRARWTAPTTTPYQERRGRNSECQCRIRRFHGAEGTAAGRDGIGLLLRRPWWWSARPRYIRPLYYKGLLDAGAAAARSRLCAKAGREDHHTCRPWLADSRPRARWTSRVGDVVIATNGLYRDATPETEAPP